ncbi:unnamed protein product [Meloidogyne enterolobii]|uniref:Uncharacterized protein n=1 Tax=Meloidogyne enterolobii TaxID=390850 RepID=A0ACB1B4K3_MELEN
MNMSGSSKFDWLLSSLTPNESQVPSTAEIIQKCLSVNPFDLKFREANQQISSSGQPGSIGDSQLVGTSGNLPATSVLSSVLNLPPSISSTHSPGIFSNINVLTADIEGEIRKTIDLSRKVQQLRENGLLSKQDDNQQLKTPCTSDVLNAVLDMSSTHQIGSGQSSPFIPSTSLIAASLSGLKAALNSTIANSGIPTNNNPLPQQQQNNLIPTSSIPNLKIEANNISLNIGGGLDGSFTPIGLGGKTMSTPDLHLTSTSLATIPVFKQQQHSPILSREALAAVFQSSTTSSYGQLHQQRISRQNSPNNSIQNEINLRTSTTRLVNSCNLAELTPSTGHSSTTTLKSDEERWKITTPDHQHQPLVVCPPQITIAQQSPYSAKSSPSEYNCNINENESNIKEIGRQQQQQQQMQNNYHGREKHKKYKKFSCGESSADSQVSSTRGGRGRRSAINDMPPDERRVTILERNKAAAVRYRKRKKEEHDEIVEKVHIIEQEKNALETQNSVLRRELERLTFLLQERESRCICKANQLQVGVSIIGPPSLQHPQPDELHQQRSPSTSSFLNGYSSGHPHSHHHPQQQIRPGSAHSAQ